MARSTDTIEKAHQGASARAPRNQPFKVKMEPVILDAINRSKGEQEPCNEFTDLVMQQRDLGTNNLWLRVTKGKRVGAALTCMRRRGLLVSEKEAKGLQKWRLR